MQISATYTRFAWLFAIALVVGACDQTESPSPWQFGYTGADATDASTDSVDDIGSDTNPTTWNGWYKASQSAAPSGFFPESELVNESTGTNESTGCNLQLDPQEPVWSVEPRLDPSPLRRYRRPGGEDPRDEPTLTDDRFGLVEITGEKSAVQEAPGVAAVIQDAEVASAPCETLRRMGRCGVPEFGDICSDGFELYSQMTEPELDVRKAGVQGGWGPLEFDIRVDFDTNVADGGTSFRIQTSNNPFGPADGRLHDFQVTQNTLTSLERICGSFGGNIVVSYPPENADGWFRTIPARTRNADKNLVLFNLTASGGSVVESAGNPNPESICPTDAFELWFAAEYEPTSL